MTASVDHFLLTRFNLPSRGRHEVVLREQENWLKNRVCLFETYCLPSVKAQTRAEFSWIIYFDPGSPEWFLRWVQEHDGVFHPVFREEVGIDDLLTDCRSVLRERRQEPSARLLTTNLDNDDSLAVDFVARLQQATPVAERSAIYLADGLIRRGDRLYELVDVHNAFCSVNESWDDPVTCWSDWHNLLPQQMPVVVLRGNPGWIQVVHGSNVSNRVRGRLARPREHHALFPGSLDSLGEPGAVLLARDRLVSAPARALGEGGRATVKAALTRIGGKRGLDGAKAVMVRGRRLRGIRESG